MNRPNSRGRLWHVALKVRDLVACEKFYVELLGMQVEWRPDADNLYLTSGADNLALHRAELAGSGATQVLDHIGFVLDTIADVDAWHDFLAANQVKILQTPKTHRDGARSFYCSDPEGNTVQMIYHPPLATRATKSSAPSSS